MSSVNTAATPEITSVGGYQDPNGSPRRRLARPPAMLTTTQSFVTSERTLTSTTRAAFGATA
jgi:hypothetical protein